MEQKGRESEQEYAKPRTERGNYRETYGAKSYERERESLIDQLSVSFCRFRYLFVRSLVFSLSPPSFSSALSRFYMNLPLYSYYVRCRCRCRCRSHRRMLTLLLSISLALYRTVALPSALLLFTSISWIFSLAVSLHLSLTFLLLSLTLFFSCSLSQTRLLALWVHLSLPLFPALSISSVFRET